MDIDKYVLAIKMRFTFPIVRLNRNRCELGLRALAASATTCPEQLNSRAARRQCLLLRLNRPMGPDWAPFAGAYISMLVPKSPAQAPAAPAGGGFAAGAAAGGGAAVPGAGAELGYTASGGGLSP